MPDPERLSVRDSTEYALIMAAYQGRCAQRSGVAYQVHIDEGLEILEALGASERAARAFCLHPLVQDDAALAEHLEQLDRADPVVVALAMEYRRVANGYLSRHGPRDPTEIELGPLPDVADMLRADKVQNYAEFLLHHAGSHPRAAALDAYFRAWLTRLGISPERFRRLAPPRLGEEPAP